MSFLMEGPISLIARLVRSEALTNDDLVLPNANRVAFEFDSIDARMSADEALATIADRADRSRLAVLKILTTAENFQYLADIGNVRDGQWYRINLLPRGKKSGPFAWASSLGGAGYEEIVPLVLDDIQYLFSEGDSPLSPIGAAVGNERALAQAIAEACKFPESAIGKSRAARNLLSGANLPHKIVVRDVGQASFCSAIDQHGNELFHLDAGWPISYNKKTTFIKPELKVADAPVILSHWDWDHLHGYHAIAGLADGTWIVPVQRLGPGAKLVAEKLATNNRLLGVSSANVSAGPLRLGRCKGKAGNLNQTGLCVQTTLQSGKTVLFMGDADYDLVRPRLTALPDFIVATHHGAKFTGCVVSPRGSSGWCVVSVGKGNGYGHPSQTAITSHMSAGWSMSFTCERNGVPRGSRHLGP
ncbi:metallo-hydrolase/oxidoreductase [Rhizobium leguminosarum bv. trifolii]|uniref:metallo-hydrolase/oxidoreductase n=1 Tax=Rhizobium ruizarguesonis TaxID=2081791 RepID=UPI001031628F|nr:metallo-hydrolase/oxidoreductase [Rhizobium ruizarguesonis]MBY5891356.1 metallo-hydrolase/oxidoreductase [Rhizobium leguminosarum]QIO44644.1 metallo-hydrolase/oxidoreductase [Rhizobium leguminosarum bv. trifolii]QND39703.1 metallo-hydrolase/oxidoreductase [Rhizobium leguminosarum bv. viciae]QSZ02082.1 metallo-hydrolase/oxidoreductase [Rhizobium ruizarguesonis]TAT98694.1 metallo-hydrolase/oxidoreductase [Rhizobium ruizarguesonis]